MEHNMVKYFSTILFFLVSNNLLLSVYCETLVPCYFVFGDSLVDNGNNNVRNTIAKANYYPYGPTGRFTNGRNIADIIAKYLGFTNHIPPFATARGNATLNGVNCASRGAGILDLTGKQFGDLISLSEQLQNHQSTIRTITSILGSSEAAQSHLSQCIYSVGMGSNDSAGYTLIPSPYTPDAFASLLVQKYSAQIRTLYGMGARKIAIFGLGTIGCVAGAVRGVGDGRNCGTPTNYAVQLFNAKVKALVDVLNNELNAGKFTYVDIFGITVSDPDLTFKYPNIPCCATSAAGMCIFGAFTCDDRAEFIYFDGIHPTEATVKIVGKRAFKAQSPSDGLIFRAWLRPNYDIFRDGIGI